MFAFIFSSFNLFGSGVVHKAHVQSRPQSLRYFCPADRDPRRCTKGSRSLGTRLAHVLGTN